MSTEIYNSTLFDDANLQAYYRLESDGTDSSPNGYTLTGSITGYVAGQFGNGGDFEASSSQFLTNTSPANCLVNGSQSWSCWVKAESTSGGVFRIMGRMLAGAPFNAVNIIVNVGDISFQAEGLTTNTIVASGVNVDVGNWQHLCGVYDSGNSKLKIFVNGVKTEVTASGTTLLSGSEALSIGRSGAYAADYFDGVVDDKAMWDRALTDAEVTDIYKNYGIRAETGSFTLTGIATIFNVSLTMIAETGTFVLTGINALLNKGYNMVASVGAFALTGQNALFNKAYNLVCAVGSFTLTGINITFNRTIIMICSVGTFTLTGISATFQKFLAGAWGTIIGKPDAPSYTDIDKPADPVWTDVDKP